MKSFVIATLLASTQSACVDDNTAKNDIILTAMTSHHATTVAEKTADIIGYETDLKTKQETLADANSTLLAANEAGEAAAKLAEQYLMPTAEAAAVQAAESAQVLASGDLTTFKTGKEAW